MTTMQEETDTPFSMWKMFNETVRALIKGDCSESTIIKLANIIQSKEFLNILICYKDPGMEFKHYQSIREQYKTFTTWLWGQFFYLLGHERFIKIHDIIIETQLSILGRLSKTQIYIYNKLVEEYLKAFDLLINYHKEPHLKLVLKLFIPDSFEDLNAKLDLSQVYIEITSEKKCLLVIGKLMKFVKYILTESFLFYSFDSNSYKTLDHLLYLLSEEDIELKLEVIDIFLHIFNKAEHNFDEYNLQIKRSWLKFVSLFEQVVYNVYNLQIELKNNIHRFESLLISYLEMDCIVKDDNRINKYIFMESLKTSSGAVLSQTVVLAALRDIHNDQLNFEKESVEFIKLIEAAVNFSSVSFYYFQNHIFEEICESFDNKLQTNVYQNNISRIWNIMHKKILDNLQVMACGSECKIEPFLIFFTHLTNMLLKIRLNFVKKGQTSHLVFFEEKEVLAYFIKKFHNHVNSCGNTTIKPEKYLNFFLNLMITSNSRNVDIIFHILAYPLLISCCYKTNNQFPDSFIAEGAVREVKMAIKLFYSFLSSQNIAKSTSLQLISEFFVIISCGLLNLNSSQTEQIEKLYIKICRNILANEQHLISWVIDTLPHAITVFEDVGNIITNILRPIFLLQNKSIQEKVTSIVPNIICCLSSDFIKVLQWNCDQSKFEINIYCEKCCSHDKKTDASKSIESKFGKDVVGVNFCKIRVEPSTISFMLKPLLAYLSNGTTNLKINSLETLPFLSSHILEFHSNTVAKIWMELAGDQNKKVREKFAEVVGLTIKYGQENEVLSQKKKTEIFDIVFTNLLTLTKKSLQFSDSELQYTLLNTIEEICIVKNERITVKLLKLLIYFIMIPTSRYSLIAVNKCFQIVKERDTTTTLIYSQNKKELCEVIVHLCSVNQALIDYSFSNSLKKVSLMLGFYNPKEFVTQESNHLLPFLVHKVVKMPPVKRLIQEMANLMDLEISEMLACKYGYIFIYLFLDIPEGDLKQCMQFLEETTSMNGPSLRKRNFRIILNELLLNFHEKRERVILALKLLTTEDTENKSNSIPDYLQSHFLGVLLYFDVRLISKSSKKDMILLSLADLFKFMGPKHIMPLRFKIIAMLQTTSYENFPHLHCQVWNAFIRSCEIESLGPQLATIFVSVLPLLEHCPGPINEIFKHLVVENEVYTRNYIPDLFFVNNNKVDREVLSIIRKSVKSLERCTLKEKIKRFLKYLNHETMEVRTQGLKQLKSYLEQSREELDQMILDYNGIDPAIVELIDILTLGCREKDPVFKLMCGEVFGELGAIEPSHLPRRYTQDNASFSFFINEDSFIVSALNELIKALQTEKNTQNMDRYALAIQEILKVHEISPEQSSSKNYLWHQFPQTQKEVMLPLLSSRYMIAQPVQANNYPTPIYGSNLGASFQFWLYNWTSSLIISLPNERKQLLQVCLPSMKQDKRILMHFLPHILLHALLDGCDDIDERSFLEFQSITSSFTEKKKLDQKALNVRPMKIPGVTPELQIVTPEEVKQMQCTKVVFLLLDFLDRWIREWQWQKGMEGRTDDNFLKVKNFQGRLCKLQLAKCNYHCGEYPRALMYLEDYVTENSGELYNHLSFLAEIYAQLEESDGVAGVTALQHNEPSVEQRILALEVCGKLADATTCYERMMQPLKLHHIQGLVQCYLDLDNVNTALNFVRGALNNQPEFGNMLLEMQAEPLWRLGQYDELDSLLQNPHMADNKNWGVQVGKALLFFKNGARNEFKITLNGLLKQQVESFGAASLQEGAYQHGYSCISKLHAITELQQVEKTLQELLTKPHDANHAGNVIKKLADEWLLRIKVVQESVRVIEPLLCMRRVSLNLTKKIAEEKIPHAVPLLNSLLGECWLLSAKTARSAGMHQQAYTYTIKAEEYAPATLFLEKAKLHWLREEHEQALTTLRRGLEIIIPEGDQQQASSLALEERKICAEARLLIATYNDSMSNVDVEENIQHYKNAMEIFKEWEKSLVCVAQYYDKIYQNISPEDRDTKGGEFQLRMINYFGKSLQYGTNYVYQSMPRLLSIWFDYGTRLLDVTLSSIKEERKNTLLKMTKLIDSYLERLPAYVFLTAFSQLVSRICHPQKEVYLELKSIIVKLLQQYPQQSLWMIISVIKSSYTVRSKRCAEILCDARLRTSMMTKLVKDFTSLAEKLIELCNKEIPSDLQSTTVTVSSLLRSLPRMLAKEDFSEIMMPTYNFRKLILPNPDFQSSQHNPFPNHYVHIVGIEEDIVVLQSLQKPRKITLKGSDGKRYIYMLKPKDDLRKDFRLMEFNDIVNHLLAREAEARQRRLNIRLYSVAPLNEECGLIEWVPDLVGLRPIILSLYKQRGLGMKAKDIKEKCCNIRDSLDKKREIFKRKMLPPHPPILGEWFRKTFPDAQSWLTARTAYIRTTAVMSMVGYILGLGDRHGENILLDSTCGDVVHVDFNCLFNKGESFDWPERVPFRLTHNMVAAMGPLGVEGIFRKSSACTLRVLRTNANTLMSIVTPFVYDPLVSWPRNISALPSVHNAERTNEQALDHIKNIELRLQGKVKTRNRTLLIPLSVDGQTNYLINEAVSIDNLCQMYIGWGPYL